MKKHQKSGLSVRTKIKAGIECGAGYEPRSYTAYRQVCTSQPYTAEYCAYTGGGSGGGGGWGGGG